MKKGYLSEYFEGVGIKTLTAVEIDPSKSNQHEFQGVRSLRDILGAGRANFPTKFIFLSDDEDEATTADSSMTWYDARENNPNRTPEYHLYYKDNAVVELASTGDTLLVAKLRTGALLAVIAEGGSTVERQLLWLFGFGGATTNFSVRENFDEKQYKIEFTSKFILESLGIEVDETDDDLLEVMIEKWGGNFPSTKEFSSFARSTLKDLNPKDDPDSVLMAWMEREEKLFKTLEKYELSDRIQDGFTDVDDFISFSLGVQNRRKSRAGNALENHLAEVFNQFEIRFGRHSNAITENKKKPDFLFPGAKEYHDEKFDRLKLTMLGSKSTCKDRWRQVVTEANKIDTKHLLTLEGAISVNQTDEMKSNKLQLVVPEPIHNTYLTEQQDWLFSVSDFTNLVLERQNS